MRTHPLVAAALILLALLALNTTAGAADQDDALQRPVLIVFDFEYNRAKGDLGTRVAEMFRWHSFRRNAFITLDKVAFEEVLEEAGDFAPTL